jgi:hypothetical protein
VRKPGSRRMAPACFASGRIETHEQVAEGPAGRASSAGVPIGSEVCPPIGMGQQTLQVDPGPRLVRLRFANRLINLARPERFELPTPRFVVT